VTGSCSENLTVVVPPPCSSAQNTCSGDTLTSQAEVNAWPGCSIVEGNLRIAGNDITDLSPLATLQKVRGGLLIDGNPLLTELSGLENVDSVGALIIAGNPQLGSISAISLTQDDIASIVIYNNDNLMSIDGFNSLTNSDNIEIMNNNALASITGFQNLQTVMGKIHIHFHPNLTEVSGFQNLLSVAENLHFMGNDVLEHISGFGNLTTVGGIFLFNINGGLKNLDGFSSLSDLKDIVIVGNNALEQVDALAAVTSIPGFLTITNNPALSDCCGVFPMLNSGSVSGSIDINGNPMPCSNEQDILDNCVSTGIDLELSLAQPNTSPAQWSNYQITATLENTGSETATGVKVSFAKPVGVVYMGGNEFSASQGTFDVFGTENWNVGSLTPGQTATLTVNYFLLNPNAPVAYAQVNAANEQDSDSTPGNGTPPLVNEDDEASTDGSTPPLPDLILANLGIQNSPAAAGEILNYSFDISNQGAGSASGNFNVKSWISTDNVISIDDIQDGIVPTGNFGPGLTVTDISGTSAIPTGLAAGQYFLILKVDANNQIPENDEGNNLLSATFTVADPGQGEADLELAMTLSATTITVGQTLTATATLTNKGPSSATNILVNTSLAEFVGIFQNISGAPSVGNFSAFGGSWNIPSLAAGASATITVTGQPGSPTAYNINFQVDGVDQPDPDSTPDNDVLTEDDLVQQLISIEPNTGDIDLSLSMTANPENPPIYTSTAVSVTVTNSGGQTATGITVDFPKPYGIVYQGGIEWTATQGAFAPFGNEQWQVGTLAPGASATLTVNYFLLTAAPLTPYAQVIAANEQDVDSTPGNGTCCTPIEDDEATLTINAFSVGNTALLLPDIIGREVQLKAVNPNPVYHGKIVLNILSRVEGSFDLECFDAFGRRAFLQKIELQQGRNDIPLDVAGLESGTYYLNMPGQNWRYMPVRFIVARW